MAKKLTPKEAKLVKAKAQGKTHKEAYIEAGYAPSTDNAMTVNANKVLSKPNVQEALEKAMEKLNLTPERALKPIDEALNSDELEMRLKGSDRALKLLVPKDNNPTVNINFNQVADKQRDVYDL